MSWVRVRDTDTGHEYDVQERSVRAGMEPVEGVPTLDGDGAMPRPPTHHVDEPDPRVEPVEEITGQPAEPDITEPPATPDDSNEEAPS